MDWSNDKVLEFIQYYEGESVIWNLGHDDHKRKKMVNDAWNRIKSNISWSTSVEDLKRKKASLMAYYRIHLNKIKKSVISGANSGDVYQTNWFAFSALDSFLRPIYECHAKTHTEVPEEDLVKSGRRQPSSFRSEPIVESGYTVPGMSNQQPSKSNNKVRSSEKGLQSEIIATKQQTDEECHFTKKIKLNESNKIDEYDLFGKLIASKIRKIKDNLEREILMNDINKLIFQAIVTSPNCAMSDLSHPDVK